MKKIIIEILIFLLAFFIFWFLIFPISLILKFLKINLIDLKKNNQKTYWYKKKRSLTLITNGSFFKLIFL